VYSLKEREDQLSSMETELNQMREELDALKRAQSEETQNRYWLCDLNLMNLIYLQIKIDSTTPVVSRPQGMCHSLVSDLNMDFSGLMRRTRNEGNTQLRSTN